MPTTTTTFFSSSDSHPLHDHALSSTHSGPAMTDLFDAYEKELLISLSLLRKNQDQNVYDHCQQLLESMQIECHSYASSLRPPLQSKLLAYQKELEDYKSARIGGNRFQGNKPSSARRGLLDQEDDVVDPELGMLDQRSKLLTTTDRLDHQNQRLEQSQRIALETEEMGSQVLSTLRRQREQIERTADTLHEADTYVDKSSRVLKSMARRMLANKLVTFLIILLLLIAIGVLIYFKATA